MFVSSPFTITAMPKIRIKRLLTVAFALLTATVAFAQRGGGGGGFGGGGGNFGGGGGNFGGGGMGGQGGGMNFQGGGGRGGMMGGFGGWGGNALNDSTELERYSGNLTFVEGRGAGSAIRDDDLKQLLDSAQFQRFDTARKKFIKGDNQETIGTLLLVPTAILTLIAATHYSDDDPGLSKKLYIISGALAVPTVTFYCMGRINRGKAKRAIDGIADEYNHELELKKAARLLQFEFEPTVFIPIDSPSAFGLTVSLDF